MALTEVGGVSLLSMWKHANMVHRFFNDGTGTKLMRAWGDAFAQAGADNFERAGQDPANRKEHAERAIAKLELAYQAAANDAATSTWKEEIMVVGSHFALRRVDAHKKAAELCKMIALAYKYVGDSTTADSNLDKAIGHYQSALSLLEAAIATNSFSPPEPVGYPGSIRSPEEEELEAAIIAFRQLKDGRVSHIQAMRNR